MITTLFAMGYDTGILEQVAFSTIGTPSNADFQVLNGRTARRIRRAAASQGYGAYYQATPPLLHAMLDPLVPAHAALARWQADVRAQFVVANVGGAGSLPAKALVGFWNCLADNRTHVGIGFVTLSGDDQWYAFIRDASDDVTPRDIYLQATGVPASADHMLSIVIDGSTRTVRFSADGVQVGAYTFLAAGPLPDKMGTLSPALRWGVITDGTHAPTQDASIYFNIGEHYALLTHEQIAEGTSVRADTPVITVEDAKARYALLAGSAYSHPDGLPHVATIWQVDVVGGDFSAPLINRLSVAELLAAKVLPLDPLTAYMARVAYVSEGLTASNFSDAVAFSTQAAGVWTKARRAAGSWASG